MQTASKETDFVLFFVTLDISVSAVTATGGGVDYTPVGSVTVTFIAGQDYIEKTITIHGDSLLEDIETFTITLENPDANGVVDKPSVATVFIIDQTSTVTN